MRRDQAALMMLATAAGGGFTPVQIQKALFLLDQEAADIFDVNSRYAFSPYDYGPFDSSVYQDLDGLGNHGLVVEQRGGRVRTYVATEDGVASGRDYLASLSSESRAYVLEVSQFVRRMSFSDLVAAIYRKYPHMKEKSVFIG